LQIASADDAKSVVRKYIVGTRTRHGKVASIMIEDEPKGPDEKGVWVVKGTFVTEDGGKVDFTCSVTSRGEVTMTPPPTAKSGKVPSKFGR
jgi:hypothetical protein